MAKAPLNWSQGFMNPEMPPAVVKALAERGFAPDGSRLPMPTIGSAFDGLDTRDRLAALDERISQDWEGMGFNPPPPPQMMADPRAQYVGNNTDIFLGANSPMANTGPEEFGQETRRKLAGINQRIDGDMMRMAEPASLPPDNRQIGGMSYTPPLPAPMPAPAIPKPTPRPRPEQYTIRSGDNPTKIARMFGMTLAQLEAKNPGILKNARRLKPGAAVNI
jgi:predicted component of type VI protein secretion system